VIIDDVYAQGLSLLMCSEVPVTFVLDGKETHVPNGVPDVSVQDVMGGRIRLMNDLGVQVFQWRGEASDLEVTLGLAYRMENGKATFLARPSFSLMSEIGGYRYPKTGVCGFVAPVQGQNICIDLNRVGNYFANRKSPSGFEFTLDRQALQPNRTAQLFAQDIRDLVHEGYRAFLMGTDSKDVATIASLREQAAMHGGNQYDSHTGTELMDAAKSYPDLLSFRLYPVLPDKSFKEVAPLHVDLDGLRRLTGIVCFMQQHPTGNVGQDRQIYIDLESPEVVEMVHGVVRSRIRDGVADPVYVMAADRLSSMLFDADPDSSVGFQRIDGLGVLCIQFAHLGRISFDKPPSNILAEVLGRWSGAIYERQFATPHGKPYQFLGRYRVLVAKSSPLANHVAELAAENRMLGIANLIADLQEDEQGYTPSTVTDFL
jgi:hypothetical protein